METISRRFNKVRLCYRTSFKTNYRLRVKTIFLTMSRYTQVYYFKTVLNKAGITLNDNDEPNVLLSETSEQSIIGKHLASELKRHVNYPNNVREFINGFKRYISEPNRLKDVFTSIDFQKRAIASDLMEEDEVVVQLNLIRLFLNVECLQDEIFDIIMEEATNCSLSNDDNTKWLNTVLAPLRYLPYVQNPTKLTKQILDIFEIAEHNTKIELLNVIPYVIPDSEFDDIATGLSKFLITNTNLTAAFIDCINCLKINPDKRSEIQNQILTILIATSSLKTFVTIFTFLMTDYKLTNLTNILLKIRDALDVLLLNENQSSKDLQSDQVMMFEEICTVIEQEKSVAKAWINTINGIRSSDDMKSIDLLILLIMHSSGSHRKNQIESIFKRKVKTGQIKITLLEKALKKYLPPQILDKYITSILEIAECFLRLHTDLIFLEFATIFYTIIFSHKYAEIQHRQTIITSLINLTGNMDVKGSIPTLHVLTTIAEQNSVLLQSHIAQLMTLLSKIENIDLKDVQQIFELLCGIIFGPGVNYSLTGYQANLHICIRKQISCSNEITKYKGIVATIATVKNMASNNLDESRNRMERSNVSISDLPESVREAANLLQRLNVYISGCEKAQGLYYDQLAQMIASNTTKLDFSFLDWLFEIIYKNFEEHYIGEKIIEMESINDIPLSYQYNLNSEDEISVPVVLRIAELTLKSKYTSNQMLIFAPLFRVLRLIELRLKDGKLSTIDALLGCGIIMPDIDPDFGLENFDTVQSKQIINCLFHCINWFREVISAFVRQKNENLKKKVLKRLNHLIELEELFAKCMKRLPEHKLPVCYFYNVNTNLDRSGTSETNCKKRKRTANINATASSTKLNQTNETLFASGKSSRKNTQQTKEVVHNFQFRELDTDIIKLFKYPLTDAAIVNPSSLSFKQLEFLLKDFVIKMNTVTKSSPTCIITHLSTVKSYNLIIDCMAHIKYIDKHLITIKKEIKMLLDQSDGMRDSKDLFTDKATELKNCFSSILEMISIIIGWSGFQNNNNLALLRECLRTLIGVESSSQLMSAHYLIAEYVKHLMDLIDYCLTLPSALHLVNILKSLTTLTSDPMPKKKLIVMSGTLLSYKWYNNNGSLESGSAANVHIAALVKAHLVGSEVETMSNIVSWVHEECKTLKKKDDCLNTFPSINKTNFPILFRGLCFVLLEALESGLEGLTNEQHLELWQNVVTTMRNLKEITTIHETKTNLNILLKKCVAIVKIFTTNGLPILEIMLRSHSESVVEILRTLQRTTRYIHNLCCHSKMTKDRSLMTHVPQMRFTLEKLVLRVKAVLNANNCSSAFWMGELRNRDLHGEEIQEMEVDEQDENEQSEEDELPEDDECLSGNEDESTEHDSNNSLTNL